MKLVKKKYFLPGMGATEAMYEGSWSEVEGAIFINWPKYEGEVSLEQVAEKLIQEYGISGEDELIGTSLGGMIACEIARLVSAKRVILVGSASAPSEVRTVLKYLSSLANITPIEMVQLLCGKYDAKLLKMFKETDAKFIRMTSKAIFKWSGLDTDQIEAVRIHGKKDKVIVPEGKTDLLIDGGHLIVMTHADECVEYLREHCGF